MSVAPFVHSCRESGSRLSMSNSTVEVALLVDIQCGSLPFVQTTFIEPEELLEVSPEGLVLGLKLHAFAPPCRLEESTAIP